MNHVVWHILRKDMVRFRLHLALWCAILIGRVACAEWAGAPQDSALQAGAMSWVALLFLFNVHLVVRVLAEDSPLEEAAFWRTRPITGGQMMAAKAMFIAAWTVLLPAGVIAAAAIYYGFTGGEMLAVVAGQVVLHGFIGFVFMTAAAFFERVIASIVCFLLFGVFLSFTTAHRVTTDTVANFERNSLVVTRTILAGGFLLAGCGLAWWLVYRSRKRVLAAVVAITGLAAMKLTTTLWSWDCLSWVAVLNSKEPRPDAAYVVSLSQVESSGKSSINGVDYRWITAAIDEVGIAQNRITDAYPFQCSVVWPDGSKSPQKREHAFPRVQSVKTALHSLGIETVAFSRFPQREQTRLNLAQLGDAEFEKLKQANADWRGRVAAVTGRVEVKARLPLVRRASAEAGAYRIHITDLRIEGRDLTLVLSERSADLPRWMLGTWVSIEHFSMQRETYALINARRSEAIFPYGLGGDGGMNGGLFDYRRAALRFTGESKPGNASPEEWSAWLKDAELVRFQFVEEKRVMTDELVVPLTYR